MPDKKSRAIEILHFLIILDIQFKTSYEYYDDGSSGIIIEFGKSSEYALTIRDNTYNITCFNGAWAHDYTDYSEFKDRVLKSIHGYATTHKKTQVMHEKAKI